MWVWIIVAVVVIGGILAFWIANAARLADRNRNLERRSPRLFDAGESPEQRERRVHDQQSDPKRHWG